MNQHQRKFLTEAIETQYKTERNALHGKKPKAPSLNNYLIAAILDGSFVMRDQKDVRKALVERVRDLGKDESLVERGYRSRRLTDDEEEDAVSIPVSVIFELPAGYLVEFKKYEAALAAWESSVAALEAAFNAMKIKVQLGSDAALESLVAQADQLCAMSLTATSRLMLAEGRQS